MAPLLAMKALPEDQYLGLFRDPEVFNNIFQSLDSRDLSETDRAVLALKLTNAFLVSNPEAEYAKAFQKALEQDRRRSQQGALSRRMTEQFFAQGVCPKNLWQELKENPRGYKLLLELLSLEDKEFLEAFVQYPNAASFLLNTGSPGIRLIDESDGEVLALSCFLSNQDQQELPKLCSRYPKLPEVLKVNGFEAFFVVMVDPDFFFKLSEKISGSQQERFLLAHAILSRQIESVRKPEELRTFLQSLTPDEKDRLAFLVGEFLERFESSTAEEDAPLPIAPLVDPFFLKFVHRYGEQAINISARFGDFFPVGKLLMEDWRGGTRDISPVLDAIKDFGEMGLLAALEFRYNEGMQEMILGPLPGSRRRDALMFLFYDKAMNLSEGMSDWGKITEKFLVDYNVEEATGCPILKKGTTIPEFMPGYDFAKVAYEAVKYGKTPTYLSLAFAALDLVELVPIALGSVTVIKDIVQHGVKAKSIRYARQYVNKGYEAIVGKIPDLIDAAKKDPLSFIRRKGGSAIVDVQEVAAKKISKKEAWALLVQGSIRMMDNKNTFQRWFEVIVDSAKASGRMVVNVFDDTKHYVTGLYKRPWMKRHATEAVINGMVGEMMLQPAIFYFGFLGISDLVNDHQHLMKLIEERQ